MEKGLGGRTARSSLAATSMLLAAKLREHIVSHQVSHFRCKRLPLLAMCVSRRGHDIDKPTSSIITPAAFNICDGASATTMWSYVVTNFRLRHK